MDINDSLFEKVENKTKVNKETIIGLAKKLSDGKMKDESTLREVVSELSKITGKEVSKEKEDKIVATILKEEVPDNVDKMF